MFQVKAPVIIVASAEARVLLGEKIRPAAMAAWHEIARRGQGIEMAHFQIAHDGATLAVCSRIRRDGFIEIELGMGDPRQAARVIPAAALRRAEARLPMSRAEALLPMSRAEALLPMSRAEARRLR